jgi:hypothetical protein
MGEQIQQCPDGHVCVCRVAEGAVQAEEVARAPSGALPAQVAGLLKIVTMFWAGRSVTWQAAAM